MAEKQTGKMPATETGSSMRKLSDVIRIVKNDHADRDDVVVELRETQAMRLELLVQELQPLLDDIPAEDDQFDLALSSGLQPRFWIDATAHVTMGRDKRTYRFMKDTRLGRVVLSESGDVTVVADHVARYIGERIVEKQRMMEGDVTPVRHGAPAETSEPEKGARGSGFLEGLMIFLLGALAGGGMLIALLWDRLAALGFDFWN
ncbi:MAG: hypothetical protein R3D65_13150 [Zhengella sp.]|uniref:hypothetical protein n=1 Tax=Zhengella sp. TaxID=2282762 RepID=UPI003529C6AD